MRFATLLMVALAFVSLGSALAEAQVVTYYSPVVTAAPVTRATVGYGPVVTNYGYGTTFSPAPTYYGSRVTYYAPAPTVSYYSPTPTVSYYAPAPTVNYYAPAPTVTYYAPTTVAAPVYLGKPAVVHSKVYYRGEPVRNLIRSVTP